MTRTKLPIFAFSMMLLFFAGMAFGQTDPGVRACTTCAGGPLASVSANANDLAFFNAGLDQFNEHQVVQGAEANGLGPRFNLDSCAGCHAQPAVGGTAPATNPQVAIATASGARNTVPSFITSTGPVREARFPFFFDQFGNPDPNSPNGGVEDLYTITGRTDAGACSIAQPSFAQAVATGNVIFRIPTPVFGSGLMQNIDDATLQTNANNNAGAFGVSGHFNHNGNDGTISRFGWKAQNKSLLIFSGEAYNVEMGVSNELFTQERPLPGEDQTTGLPANCRINPTPEDITHTDGVDAASVASDAQLFVGFMQFLAPPTPSTTTPGGSTSISAGRTIFSQIGCSACHTPSLRTDPASQTAGLGNATANLFSDLEVHHMGTGLADNVGQGGAGGDEFRSSPLWGLGQRIFFLHDGRTKNLITAITQHSSNGSEANTVISNFNALSATNKQNLLNFLRSL